MKGPDATSCIQEQFVREREDPRAAIGGNTLAWRSAP
jgi:hypothetical protein